MAGGRKRTVRVELMAGEDAWAIARAIEAQSDEAEVEEYPGILVVRAPGRIVLERAAVEEELGRSYNLRDIQGILPAYYGYWKETSSERWVLEWIESGDGNGGGGDAGKSSDAA
jgi:phenol hydroxylase P2 protein